MLGLCKERRIIKVFDLQYLHFLQSMSKSLFSYCEVRGIPYELATVFFYIKLEDAASPIIPLEKGLFFKCVDNTQCSKFKSVISMPGLAIIKRVN